MLFENLMAFLVPAVAFLITGTIAYFSGRARSASALIGTGLLWAGFTVWMFFGMQQSSGWDGLGYLIALLFLSAPAGAGFGLGGLIGWLRGRKDIYA